MNIFDRIDQETLRRLAELEKDPSYKALKRVMEEERRNPGLRIAREMALRQIEEERRNPALRILRNRLDQEQNNALLGITRERLFDQGGLRSVFDVSSRILQHSGGYT